ncbi:hypothetical protein KH990_04975 [Methanoculleus bourgensis]|uniref:Uncharacterized protein n=1 Tax=Methanoculleus bourgensis TaxID=83986 RepID=A0A0X8XYU8_9EURY|nr:MULTISPECIES: hypothetical protein [Methanoculleus]MBT0732719.1 hypothetical protein [Methanoculleus bourgensis]CVK34586.1 conserved exported protein of unknown function [Methanoculleus bourgensis]
MLSLDFLAGFTIFLLALIMVVSMVPGLLAGLESSGIDYDAVAYRTGVILVEDPGWPVNPPWEQYGRDHKDEIQRMGLAVSKDTPNILLSTKVERFFENASTEDPFFTEDDYHNKVIFGDYPYSYNISLSSGNDLWQTGDPLPPGYGYIRRVVKIKEPSVAEINESISSAYTIDPSAPEWQNSTARNFTVRLDFGHLLDPTVSPAYRIDPRIEPVNVTITNFDAYLNNTYDSATLKSVTFQKAEPDSPPVPLRWLSYSEEEPDLYTLHLDEDSHSLTPNEPVNSSISLVLKPAFMTFMGPNSILDIRFNFEEEEDEPPHTNIAGTFPYNYDNVNSPPLKTGVLEVAIW